MHVYVYMCYIVHMYVELSIVGCKVLPQAEEPFLPDNRPRGLHQKWWRLTQWRLIIILLSKHDQMCVLNFWGILRGNNSQCMDPDQDFQLSILGARVHNRHLRVHILLSPQDSQFRVCVPLGLCGPTISVWSTGLPLVQLKGVTCLTRSKMNCRGVKIILHDQEKI